MNIIAIYPLNNDKHGYFDIIPVGVFISPFYAGDNIHHLTLDTDMDFRDRLHNHHKLISNGRTDLKPIVFRTMQEAEIYANAVTFGVKSTLVVDDSAFTQFMNDNGL